MKVSIFFDNPEGDPIVVGGITHDNAESAIRNYCSAFESQSVAILRLGQVTLAIPALSIAGISIESDERGESEND